MYVLLSATSNTTIERTVCNAKPQIAIDHLLPDGTGILSLIYRGGRPWENGYIESFNGKLRDELVDREIFTTLLEAKVLIES